MQRERSAPVTTVSLAEVASVISRAADLATGQPLDHVVRSCAISTLLAERLELGEDQRAATYWVSLLMISGCSAVSFEMSRLFGDDIDLRGSGYALGPSTLEQAKYLFGRADGGSRGKTRVRLELIGRRLQPFLDAILSHCSINARLAEALALGGDVRDALTKSFAHWNG
jgi:hypothetical protein